MSKKLTPQGNVENEKNIEDKKVRTPVLTQNLSGAKVDPQGYLYKEEEIDGTIGYIPVVSIEGSGGGGAVTSVNTKTGDVVLNATDVGAEPAFVKNTAFNKNFGTFADTVAEGSELANKTQAIKFSANRTGVADYCRIGSLPTSAINGTNPSGVALLVSAPNDYGYNTISNYLVNFSTKGSIKVEAINMSEPVADVFGYSINGNEVELWVKRATYAYDTTVTVLNRTSNFKIAPLTQSATPTGFASTTSVKSWDSSNLPYETGVWAPEPYNTGIAFTINKAEFVRIGKTMKVYCNLTITADGTNSNYFHIAGLPKVPTSTHKLGHVLFSGNTGFADTYSLVSATTIIGVFQRNATLPLGYNTILNNQLKMGQKIFLDIEYFV